MATSAKRRLTPTQARAARRVRQARRKRMLRYGGLSAIAFVSLIFIVGLILPGLPIGGFGGGNTGGDIFSTSATDAARASGEDITEIVDTSGGGESAEAEDTADVVPDVGVPVPWGVHANALPREMYAANIQDGGVGILYNCPDGCDALVEQLSDIVDEVVGAGGKALLIPSDEIDTQISLTSAAGDEALEAFDEDRIRTFIDANSSDGGP